VIIFPAIDIKNGKVVRLSQGKFDDVTVYSDDPIEVAKGWEKQGAEWLHIVDLDGAQTGNLKNFEIIRTLSNSINIPIQLGGGIRNESLIAMLLEEKKGSTRARIDRVIMGTSAIEDQPFLQRMIKKWGVKIGISLDCSNGYIASRGWSVVTKIKAMDIAKKLEEMGLQYLVYTDISKDGMLTGPNLEGIKEILNTVRIPVIVSGGVSNLDDIKKLKALTSKGLEGIIVGKALYEGRLDLKEAIRICSQKE